LKKNNQNKIIYNKLKISVLSLFFMFTASVYSQVEQVKDSIGYDKGKMELKNPPSVVEAYTYDEKTDRYILSKTIDGFNMNYPLILTPKEYEARVRREAMHKYFKEKADAIDGKKEGTEAAKRNLLPRFYINNSFFETIFGSNTIDVKPTGSVEIDLGMRYTKQDNPSFSPQNRSTTTFDFNQRISMGLQGMVGTRLGVNANYDTQSTFAFQNLIKLNYTPEEDNILQKLEVGNVSLPLSSSLIKGVQSLFGVKAQLQFGRTTLTGVYSEQKSQTKAITAQGGGAVQEFNLFALDYDTDRHFFLSQYFRNKYDSALRNYPLIDSRVQITRIEVWVTNRQNRISNTENNLRNIVALQDLGESRISNIPDNEIVKLDSPPSDFFVASPDSPPSNENNKYNPELIALGNGYLNSSVREIVTTNNTSFRTGLNVSEGQDYSKLENARKLTTNEYTFHPQLGYISLQQRLSNDEILGVAYQYTIGDKVYQVGEFGNGGVDATNVTQDVVNTQNTVVETQSLVVKMLKSSLLNVRAPVWNLMMKNIYQVAVGGQLEQQDFRFNILYSDPSPLNYISPVGNAVVPNDVEDNPYNKALLKVFNVDRLNFTNDPQKNGDGFFDFVPGITMDTQNGRIIFTTVEPFGKHLFEKLKTPGTTSEIYNSSITYNDSQKKYVFSEMYTDTYARALQSSDKNKFQLRGKYKSVGGDGISIGAFNVPRGSVLVTAGGRVLVEGVDYSVNYQLGRVIILDPSLKASNIPINISVENNSVFGQQTRRFYGFNIEHKFSDKFLINGTFLRMTERPFTQKSSYGQESVNNTIFGFNGNFTTEVPFLTRMVNKLPNIDTDVPSNLAIKAEVAWLRPDTPNTDQFEGKPTVYVDDFEDSQNARDMKSPLAWTLSSVPLAAKTAPEYDFGITDGNEPSNESELSFKTGFKRAKLAWHLIDQTFYTNRPSNISEVDMEKYDVRRIDSRELFPDTDIAEGQTTIISTLDLNYYPKERGPYNYSDQAIGNELPNPKDNFGGIIRSINQTNFEQTNVEYIQFWMLDPYFGTDVAETNTGKLYFNLGQISEDVLRDGRKQYENGLPTPGSNINTTPTQWGDLPQSQSLIYAFDTDEANRAFQDIGLDGLNDDKEKTLPANKNASIAALPDPSGDNYNYFLSVDGGVLDRYKNYNGTERNSPVNITTGNRGSATIPDVEDINRDNTMSTINAYYQYSIDVKKDNLIGQNYVTDIRTSQYNLSNGERKEARWVQYKIPIDQKDVEKFGGIESLRSIQFMRMFMTGFTDQITLRFGTLQLVSGEWRRFAGNLFSPNLVPLPDPNTENVEFVSQAVSIQDNASSDVTYVAPPGVVREQLLNNNTVINQNEQSLALRIGNDGLAPQDSRAAFKNVSVDMRQYKRLKMFLHGQKINSNDDLNDDELAGFIRFGNDFDQNYYQVEVPLKLTAAGDSSQFGIWPKENNIDLPLESLTKIKIRAGNADPNSKDDGVYSEVIDDVRISIKGNPNYGLVRTLMVGVKNVNPAGSPRRVKGEVWFNELRLEETDNSGGMAAVASVDSNIADFATISATGRMSTIGFGALENTPNERSREDVRQYNIVTNLNVGKLLPKKWGVNLPFNYGIGEEIITPEYDPFNQDILLKQLIDESPESEKSNIRNRAINFTKNRSINFIGVKKERAAEKKQHVYDIENVTLSYSYNETLKHDFEVEDYKDQQIKAAVDYAYNFSNKPIEPFSKNKFFKKSSYWKWLSDFNFNYLPSTINFSSNILRQYNKQQFRLVEVEGVGLDPLYRRNYLFGYNYGFNFNVTKSLKLNYSASSANIVRSYLDENKDPIDKLSVWHSFLDTGIPDQHSQQLTVNYELPFGKFPFLSFIKSNYTYTSDYNWRRASDALALFEDEAGNKINLGNTIQNNGSHKLATSFNMDGFYKYIGLVKIKDRKPTQPKPTGIPKPGEKIKNTATVQKSENIFLDGLIGVITSLKNVQANYTETGGTVLPGYLPSQGFFGSSRPTLGFVFGSQADVRYEAAKNGWLTTYQDFNQSFTQVNSKTFDLTANMDLFPDLKIDLLANRTYVTNASEQFDVSNGNYNARSPYDTGNFAISTNLISTAFSASDENQSEAFEAFRNNRLVVAQRLAAKRGITAVDEEGFPIGFGKKSVAVLLPSFLAAYQGTSASGVSLSAFRSIPIPSWNVKYTGLMRYVFFKENFKRFSLQHGYRATYTINSFRTNLDYLTEPNKLDTGGNFPVKTLVSNANLVEQFNPLIRMDMELKNSVKILGEIKKDRALSMSFDNNLLTEVKGLEYIIGLGYRIKDVRINTSLADNPDGVLKSDINIKADFSLRDTKTIVRNLDYENNQLAGGQNLWSLRLTADYALSKNLSTIFYYDHNFSQAVISTSFPITNLRAGLTIRYNFGN
jgi:cell surface protein SprA